ncbi:MAG: HEAT repeat domain-containing protein [Armatimonadetes bacterium]|nr:HEAT repeat domain-containing protein [Armatimonadota bacterium]
MRKRWAWFLVIFALFLLGFSLWLPRQLPLFSPIEQAIGKAQKSEEPKERLTALLELQKFAKEKSLTAEQRQRVISKLFGLADKDSDEQVRNTAIKTLWLLGERGKEMQRVLVNALNRSPQEASLALELLPQIASEPIWLSLIELYEQQKDPTAKDRLKRVLQKMPTSLWEEFCKRLARKPKIWQPVLDGLEPPNYSFRSNLVSWALSKDQDLRKGALLLLFKFPPSPSEAEKLKPLSNSQDLTVRTLVFSIWSNSPSKAIVPELQKGLKDRPEIAYLASSALLKLGELRNKEGRKLLSHPYAPLRAQGALALATSHSSNDWKALLEALKDPEPEVVRNAAIALVAKGNKGLLEVMKAYEREEKPERKAAMLTAMAGVSHPKVFALLVKVLRFGDWREKSIALAGISLHKDKMLASLERISHSQNKNDRMAAIEALSAIKTTRALRLLLQIAKTDPDEQIRCDAALTLSNYGVKEVMPILAELVRKGETSTATSAAMVLARYGEEGRKILQEMIKSERRETRLAAARALVAFNDRFAIEILREQMSNEDLTQRIATLQLLARSGDERALRELVSFLSHDEPEIRLRARLSIYTLGKRAVPILLQYLDSSDSKLRAEAALILGALKVKEAQEKLSALLKDEDPKVREAAQMSLSRLEGEE